jgi:hypothetical protein
MLWLEIQRELNFAACCIGDEGIRILADALVGNTTMELLDIWGNCITCVGLADITRLLVSMPRLHTTIGLRNNKDLFMNNDATQHFVAILQHKNSSVQELEGIREDCFPIDNRAATYASINNSLARNQQLHRLDGLLLVAPQQQRPQPPDGTINTSTTLFWLKVWHKAIAKFSNTATGGPIGGAGGSNAGASAIFKLFTARPQLLEKRIQRPTTTTTAAAAVAAVATVEQECKRRRL